MNYITLGQANRIKTALLIVPHLIAASTYTWNGNHPCLSIGYPTLQIYPNPSKDFVYLDLKDNPDGLYTYRIINQQGTIYISGTCSNEIKNINISHLNSGIYIVQITSGENTISKNLIIQ